MSTKQDTKSVETEIKTISEEDIIKRRAKRVLTKKAKLDLPCPDGFVCRWIQINSPDRPGRFMEICVNNTYTPVRPHEINLIGDDGKPVSGDTITVENKGNGELLYVKQPIEFFDDDQRQKTKRNLAAIKASSTNKDGEVIVGQAKVTFN